MADQSGLDLSWGLPPSDAAVGYQTVLFYALGFAVLEAPFTATSDSGADQQRQTQFALAGLSPQGNPHVAATIQHLYTPDLDGQVVHGLRLLLDGLRSRASSQPFEATTTAPGGKGA